MRCRGPSKDLKQRSRRAAVERACKSIGMQCTASKLTEMECGIKSMGKKTLEIRATAWRYCCGAVGVCLTLDSNDCRCVIIEMNFIQISRY